MAWSEEVQGLVRVVTRAGIPHRVSSVCRAGPWVSSYHNRQGTGGCGLAVDFDAMVSFDKPVPHQPFLDIFNALAEHSSDLAELIYSGADFYVKNGRHIPIEYLSSATRDAHWNHVHSAVALTKVLVGEPPPTGEGTLVGVNGKEIIAFHPAPDGKGYWYVTADGAVYAFGSAGYLGRIEKDANGNWQALYPGP